MEMAGRISHGLKYLFLIRFYFWEEKDMAMVGQYHGPEVSVTGFATFFIDVAMGILTILFNRQIMKYLDTDALAVYGVIVNISTFAQCCAYSVGQAWHHNLLFLPISELVKEIGFVRH